MNSITSTYKIAGGILLVIILCLLMTTNVFGLIQIRDKEKSLWLLKIFFWLSVIIMMLYARLVEHRPFLSWKESRRKTGFYFLSTAITITVIFVLLTIISIIRNSLFGGSNNEVLNEVNNALKTSTALYVFSAFTAAVTEELIFRGYLLTRLDLLLKHRWFAIIVSSILFGLAHFTYGDVSRMLFPFVIGIIFAFHYSKYKSLIALVVCHLVIDLVMV